MENMKCGEVGRSRVWRGVEVESVKKEWEKVRDMVMECTNDVCGMRRVGGQRRKGSEWRNEEVGKAVAEKSRAFEEWLKRRDRVTYDRYRAQRVAVKLAVQAAKRMADRQWEERLGNNFEGNKTMFWKEVKRVRNGEQTREEMVKDVNGQIFARWRRGEKEMGRVF